MSVKIIIVGAGPVGCFTAQALKGYGFDPLLIEEHSEVGRPVHCTGLVGSNLFSDPRPFSLPGSAVKNTINGAVIHNNGMSFSVKREKVAYVIDRESFDRQLSQGLNILTQNRLMGIEKSVNGGYIVETDNDQLSADIVIGADGANSGVRRIIGQDSGIETFKGIQFRMALKVNDPHSVEVYLSGSSFFWVVPEGEDVVRVGTVSENPFSDLQEFLKVKNIKGEVLDKFGGCVAVGLCKNTVKDNIALVGDAACQVKPLTYGGVYFGLRCGEILASCIKEGRIQDYDALWKKEFASEIRIGLKVKEVYKRLSKEELDKLFKLAQSQKSVIEKLGDFENHSRLFSEILKNPRLYPQLGELFKIFFKAIL